MMGKVDYFMSKNFPGTCRINEGRRGAGESEDKARSNEGSETGDKGRVGSEAPACFHQLNCNHTV